MNIQQMYDRATNHIRYGNVVKGRFVDTNEDGSCSTCVKGLFMNITTKEVFGSVVHSVAYLKEWMNKIENFSKSEIDHDGNETMCWSWLAIEDYLKQKLTQDQKQLLNALEGFLEGFQYRGLGREEALKRIAARFHLQYREPILELEVFKEEKHYVS